MKWLSILLGTALILLLATTIYYVNYIKPNESKLTKLRSGFTPKIYEATCGGTRFRVAWVYSGGVFDNRFTLSTFTKTEEKILYKNAEGGFFHAACLTAKTGKQLMVFQDYCGGTGCVESKYGAIDPSTLQIILRPNNANIDNGKDISNILGFAVPHLFNLK